MKIVRNGNSITTINHLKPGDLFILSRDRESVYILTNKQQNGERLAIDLENGIGFFPSLTLPVVKVDGTLYIEEAKKNDTNN